MNEIIQDGKTQEEALEAALDIMGVPVDQVDVEVLEKPREGLFGFLGSRTFKLKVTLKEELDAQPDLKPQVEEEDRQPVFDSEEQPASLSVGEENPEDQVIEFLQKVLDYLQVDCSLDVHEGEQEIFVNIDGEDAGVIIGKFGQTLDSLQYLTNVIIGKKFSNKKKIVMDVGDYRSRREESVTKLARSVARKVVKSRKSEALSPMSPQDRRTVHIALTSFKEVDTSSEGTGTNRKVIISFAG